MNTLSSIYVIDSGSTDGTAEISRDLGAKVFVHPFENHARQFNWALDNVVEDESWVMRLDADEVLSENLRRELDAAIRSAPPDVHGFELNRRHIFMGKFVRHGGRSPLFLLRVWRAGTARAEDRWMDEHIILTGDGRIQKLHGYFDDENLNDLAYFVTKHNNYATREAVDQILRRRGIVLHRDSAIKLSGVQQRLKRWAKLRLYGRLRYPVAAKLYYWWRMIPRLGFLDGRTGRQYHYLQGYWYRYLAGARAEELESLIHTNDPKLAVQRLEELTGLNIVEDVRD